MFLFVGFISLVIWVEGYGRAIDWVCFYRRGGGGEAAKMDTKTLFYFALFFMFLSSIK